MLLFIASLYGFIIEPSRSMLRLAPIVVLTFIGIAVRIDTAAYFVAGLALSYKLVIDRSYAGASGQRRPISQKLRLAVASGAAVATIVACVGLVSVFNGKTTRATPRLALQASLVHDLAGISVRAGQNLMPGYAVSAGVDLARCVSATRRATSIPCCLAQRGMSRNHHTGRIQGTVRKVAIRNHGSSD